MSASARIALLVFVAACGSPASPVLAPEPEPAAPLEPVPPPTDELGAQLPWELFVMYRDVTEMAAPGTDVCEWPIPIMMSITALYGDPVPAGVDPTSWNQALGAIDASLGAMERACEEATDPQGRYGELRLDVEAGVRLVLKASGPRS